jgi:uncharacterized protein (TIRG00374 family)
MRFLSDRGKRNQRFKWLYLIGPLLFLAILRSIDAKKTYQLFVNARLFPIIVGLLLLPIEVLIRAYQLRRVVSLKASLPFLDAVKAHLIGVSFGTVTPGGWGSFAKLEMIKKSALLDTVSALALVAVDKLLSLLTLLLIGTMGLFIAVKHLKAIPFFPLLIFALISLLVFVTIFFSHGGFHALLSWVGRVVPQKYGVLVTKPLSDAGRICSLFAEKRRKSLVIVGLSLVGWMLLFTRIFFYARALGIQVSFLDFLFIFPITTLMETMPVSIMGVGTRDVTLIFLFSRIGIDPERAISLSMMCLVLLLVFEVPAGFIITSREYIGIRRLKLEAGEE